MIGECRFEIDLAELVGPLTGDAIGALSLHGMCSFACLQDLRLAASRLRLEVIATHKARILPGMGPGLLQNCEAFEQLVIIDIQPAGAWP